MSNHFGYSGEEKNSFEQEETSGRARVLETHLPWPSGADERETGQRLVPIIIAVTCSNLRTYSIKWQVF